jgi:Calcineurin-like phosphoesterase
VHGNAVALEPVLHEVAEDGPDLVVFGGDLTWGPLADETFRLVDPLRRSAIFVRGNAERALAEEPRDFAPAATAGSAPASAGCWNDTRSRCSSSSSRSSRAPS